MSQQKIIVLITLASMLCCFLYIVALNTDHWLEATAVLTDTLRSNVSYGLFSGRIVRHQLASTLKFSITVVCSLEANACMFSCQSDLNRRKDELKRVLRGQDLKPCEQSNFYKSAQNDHKFQNATNIATHINDLAKISPGDARNAENKPAYISASLYMCSVMFFCLSFAFALLSCICSAINLKWHPVESIFNVYGLFIWNGIAVVCCFWSLAFWSALFANQLRYNIAVTDTLRQQLKFTSDGYASLGYSYYLLIIIMMFHIINIVLLFVRNYSIGKESQQVPNSIVMDEADARLEYY